MLEWYCEGVDFAKKSITQLTSYAGHFENLAGRGTFQLAVRKQKHVLHDKTCHWKAYRMGFILVCKSRPQHECVQICGKKIENKRREMAAWYTHTIIHCVHSVN